MTWVEGINIFNRIIILDLFKNKLIINREAKAVGGSMNLKQKLPNFDALKDLGISCDGNKVTMTVIKVKWNFCFKFFD